MDKAKTEIVLKKISAKLAKLGKGLRKWGHDGAVRAADQLAEAAEGVETALVAVGDVPEESVPRRGVRGKSLAEGATLLVQAEKRSAYAGVIAEGDLDNLALVKKTNKSVVVKTSDGTLLVLPRTHVRMAASPTPA